MSELRRTPDVTKRDPDLAESTNLVGHRWWLAITDLRDQQRAARDDRGERRAFERIVTAACGGAVAQRHIADLISDLQDQLTEDGLDTRIQRLGEGIARREHAQEVIRIAALIAQCSEDVSEVERSVLEKLAASCKLEATEVDAALADVKKALHG